MSKEKESFSIQKRVKSFGYSIAGLKHLFLYEHNARIHLIAAVLVIIAGWYFEVSRMEWLAIVLCIGLVIITETLNTAIEVVCDYLSPDFHPKIKIIKDLASGAVLVSALTAVVIAAIIFIPKLLLLMN